jgi:hypothetical protein
VADTDELVHGSAAHSIGNDHGSGDLEEQIIQMGQCITIHEPVGIPHGILTGRQIVSSDENPSTKSGHDLTIWPNGAH